MEGLANVAGSPESQEIDTANISPTGHQDFWHQPRKIWLKRSGVSGDYYLNYWANGQVNTQDYIKACYLLMDTHVNQAVQMDIQLLNLMFAIQGWLGINGIHLPMMINSGFRSRRTNNALEGAAKNSMHLYGKAADIRIPGIPIDYLGKLSSHFSAGGVGFYIRKGFVHIDTGRIRHWKG